MDVDEARRDDQPIGVDFQRGFAGDPADRPNPSAGDAEIGLDRRRRIAGADSSAADDGIEGHWSALWRVGPPE